MSARRRSCRRTEARPPNGSMALGATVGLVAMTLVACSSLAGGGTNSGRDVAALVVVAEPETATVYVNERFAGTAKVLADKPEVLAPGVHFVTIRAPGYFPHDLRLELPPGRTTVRISLRPVPP